MRNSATWIVIAIALLSTTAQSSDKILVDSSFFKNSQAEISLKKYLKYLKDEADIAKPQ